MASKPKISAMIVALQINGETLYIGHTIKQHQNEEKALEMERKRIIRLYEVYKISNPMSKKDIFEGLQNMFTRQHKADKSFFKDFQVVLLQEMSVVSTSDASDKMSLWTGKYNVDYKQTPDMDTTYFQLRKN